MSVNISVRDRSIGHQVWMHRLFRTHAREMMEFMQQFELSIVDRIAASSPGTFKRGRMEQLIASTREMWHEGMIEFNGKTREMIRSVGDRERKWLKRVVKDTVPIEIAIRQPSLQQLYSAVIDSPMNGLPIRNWLSDLERGTMRQIEREIRNGYVAGDTPIQISRRIRGSRAAGYADGVFGGPVHRRMEAFVRTAMSHAQQTAREITYSDNEDLIKGVQIVATLDERTSLICMNYDGQVFPIGEGPRPPFHPNCRTTTVPVLKSWRELGYDRDELPEGTRASIDGQVPEKTRFPDWLESQPAARQVQVLGQARYRAWRDGEVALSDLTVDSRPLSLAELGIER